MISVGQFEPCAGCGVAPFQPREKRCREVGECVRQAHAEFREKVSTDILDELLAAVAGVGRAIGDCENRASAFGRLPVGAAEASAVLVRVNELTQAMSALSHRLQALQLCVRAKLFVPNEP